MKIKIILFTALIMSVFIVESKAQEWHVSYNYSYYAPAGFSIGYLPNNIGGYVSGKFGTKGGNGDTKYYSMDEIAGVSNYERLGTKRSSFSGGVMVRLIEKLAIYGGAGYGTYGESWGEKDGEESDVYVVKDQFAGPEAELGLMYLGDVLMVGIGGIFMNGTNVDRKAQLYDISVQVGVRF